MILLINWWFRIWYYGRYPKKMISELLIYILLFCPACLLLYMKVCFALTASPVRLFPAKLGKCKTKRVKDMFLLARCFYQQIYQGQPAIPCKTYRLLDADSIFPSTAKTSRVHVPLPLPMLIHICLACFAHVAGKLNS